MQLSFEQIKSITLGAVSVTQEKDGVHFYRFRPEQYELYKQKKEDFFNKAFASSGVKICFQTDSSVLELGLLAERSCTRSYFSVDVYVDGELVGCLRNFDEQQLPRDYSVLTFPLGQFEKQFLLGEGVKTVEIYLPWNTKTVLQKLNLADGAFVLPVKPEKKLLAYGDSITQGFDALMPSRRYAAQLAKALCAEECNRAIGGECFCPEIIGVPENLVPDYILVAYGTNDWSKLEHSVFRENCKAFFAKLAGMYPGVPTFALTPIWRSNEEKLTPNCGPFDRIEKVIREESAKYPQIRVIRGYDLVPHDLECFGDYGLHPSNLGFDHYFANLWKELH